MACSSRNDVQVHFLLSLTKKNPKPTSNGSMELIAHRMYLHTPSHLQNGTYQMRWYLQYLKKKIVLFFSTLATPVL